MTSRTYRPGLCHDDGGSHFLQTPACRSADRYEAIDGLIYLIGLIVIIMAILSFFRLRLLRFRCGTISPDAVVRLTTLLLLAPIAITVLEPTSHAALGTMEVAVKKINAFKSLVIAIALALLVGVIGSLLFGGKESDEAGVDKGRTTEATAGAAGAQVTPTEPKLRIEPK